MAELPNEVLFDARLVERHIRQGLVTREQYEGYLAQLNDVESEADRIDLDSLARRVAQSASTALS
jgi:hypothetical protein